MTMKRLTSGLENAVPHVVYDLSLPLEERREKAMVFKSGKAAATFLGVPFDKIHRYRTIGKRIEKNGKLYAVRIKRAA